MTEKINEVFPLHTNKRNFIWKLHEENQYCIKIAVGTKFSPRKNKIALKCHHFKSHIKSGRVDISYTPTNLQFSDLLTKTFQTRVYLLFITYFLVGVTIMDGFIRVLSTIHSQSIFFFLRQLNNSVQELILLFLQQLNKLKYLSGITLTAIGAYGK